MASPSTQPDYRGTGDPVSLAAALAAGKKLPPDATLLLVQDHREAVGYLDWYAAAPDEATKMAAARKLCAAMRAHMTVEEEIFYPHARDATGHDSLIDHSLEEHDEAAQLVEKIEQAVAEGRTPDETVASLRAAVEEHVSDEEGKLFPRLRETDVDLYDLGRKLASRRVECLFELTGRTAGSVGTDDGSS